MESIKIQKINLSNYQYYPRENDEKYDIQLSLYLNLFCNINCSYCYIHKEFKNSKSKIISHENFSILIKFIKMVSKKYSDKNIKIIILGGEPSLILNLIEKLYKTLSKLPNVTSYIFTNTINNFSELIQLCIKYNQKLNLSIHFEYFNAIKNNIKKNINILNSLSKNNNLYIDFMLSRNFNDEQEKITNILNIFNEYQPRYNFEVIDNSEKEDEFLKKKIEILSYYNLDKLISKYLFNFNNVIQCSVLEWTITIDGEIFNTCFKSQKITIENFIKKNLLLIKNKNCKKFETCTDNFLLLNNTFKRKLNENP